MLGLCVGAALAGCGDHADLRMWGMSYAGENAPILLPRFTRQTGLTVELQSLPWGEAHEKIVTAYAGGALPDVLMVADDWLPELVAIGALRSLTGSVPLAEQLPAAAGAVMVGDHCWAQPWSIGTQAQFYRPDLIARAGYAEPPPRRDEWVEMLRRIKRRAPDDFALLMLLDWPEHLMTFAAQVGAEPLRDHASRGNFSSPAFREALGFYKSLFDAGLAPRVTVADIGDPATAFGRGLVAVMPSGSYTVSDLLKPESNVPRARWRVAPMPGPDGIAPAPVGGNGLAITAHARSPAKALALIRYLASAGTQLDLYHITGELPTQRSAWASPALAGDAVAQVFARQMARPATGPTILEWPRIQTEMQLVAERLARGAISVDDAAAEMDRRADRLLAKRRWLLDRGLTI